jgi:hypothetical protein
MSLLGLFFSDPGAGMWMACGKPPPSPWVVVRAVNTGGARGQHRRCLGSDAGGARRQLGVTA